MARSLDIDLTAFIRALEQTPEVVGEAAKRGLHDALDEWQDDARNLAPQKKGRLRSEIKTNIDVNGAEIVGSITANVIEVADRGKWSGKRFNYAYYLHEKFPRKSFKNPSTPGTIPEFIDQPAVHKSDDWIRGIENEIKDELRRKGW